MGNERKILPEFRRLSWRDLITFKKVKLKNIYELDIGLLACLSCAVYIGISNKMESQLPNFCRRHLVSIEGTWSVYMYIYVGIFT